MHMVASNFSSDNQELSSQTASCYEKFEQETFKIHHFAQPNNIEFINQVSMYLYKYLMSRK